MTVRRQGLLMSPQLLKVMDRASKDPNMRFNSLAHLLNEAALKRAFGRIRKDAAVGVDGVDKEAYGENLDENIRSLHERLKAGRYRHKPIRRVHIPKGDGRTRPIGISTIEDKIVQGALCEVLEAIYEQDFVPSSFGFRRGRGAHDALRMLNQMANYEGIQWIVEADIKSFFDSVDREKLREMLQIRVADGSLMRLVGKCLHVGILDGVEYSTPEEGTVQGSIISPLLGNVYLHYVLDVWFEREVLPELSGHARLIRYADDFVIGCSSREDAERVMEWLHERMAAHGLTLHPDKTRLVPFNRPKKGEPLVNADTFDFLGFTMYWRRTRRGGWTMTMKTRKASLRRAVNALGEWCRSHRHLPRKVQHAALTRRLNGHYNYFGVNGNTASLKKLYTQAVRLWLKWLLRRSQRKRLTWKGFGQYLRAFPLPRPVVRVQIWGARP